MRLADDEPYRRAGRAQANRTEGRLGLGHNIFHGRKDETTRAHLDGIENQLSAFGLILNCVVLWNSVYLDRALDAPRTTRSATKTPPGCRRSFANTSGCKATTASTCPTWAVPTGRCATRKPPDEDD
ncbi:Tn3 family transposase [Nocardia rhizosphaerihabitans]|uniref:Tn3 family transposase n=1 Tax=Nocardia rhizosphaerihabitans TaxID=1691570 RepID=UPI003672C910